MKVKGQSYKCKCHIQGHLFWKFTVVHTIVTNFDVPIKAKYPYFLIQLHVGKN